MSYQQVKPFNRALGGATPNFCLLNVIKGYGIPRRYDDAWTAWLNTEQHSGEPPAGLDIPVYFSYTATLDGIRKNWGHIGVRLANGQFWSDGKVYTSIAAYTANHWPVYVGWGESVNEVVVIKQEDAMTDADKQWFENRLAEELNKRDKRMNLIDNPGEKMDQAFGKIHEVNERLDELIKSGSGSISTGKYLITPIKE